MSCMESSGFWWLLSPWPLEVPCLPSEYIGITHFSLVTFCDDSRGTIEFYLVLFGEDYLLNGDYAQVGFSN